MNESTFRRKLIEELRNALPGCVILKNDPSYIQGIPDIIILCGTTWAALEVKVSEDANVQVNQEYYVELLDSMSYASFVNPENMRSVLYDLQFAFGFIGPSRVPQS